MNDYAVLRFLPWMRRGIARELTAAADADGVPTATLPAVDAAVTVGGTEIVRSIRVRGPGAVVGLVPAQIVRQDPLPGTLDYETNYFPAIELASPDLPWMFTPAAPKANRLMPWLVLVVVEEREGVTLATRAGAPLQVLSIDDATRELPNLREAWAWAHVQAAVELTPDVDTAFLEQPEAFVARLMCARRLGERTPYLACLVPSFEAGRLAGLGLTVNPDAAPALAWSDTTTAVELPVYCSWSFRTAAKPGDFEALVRRLTARTLGSGVGVHDLDIGDPGSARLPRAPGTIVGFTGALVSPTVKAPVWDSGHRATFQDSLRTLLNEAPTRAAEDPVVAPPAYGALPAGLDAVPAANARATRAEPKWLSQANLDPANRSAAGLGAEVVRRNQESLVAEAWDQAAALREVNRVLNRTRLALEVGGRIKLDVDALEDGALLQFSRAAHSRLKRSDMTTTLEGRIAQSDLPGGLISGAFRRRLRPGTTVSRAVASSASPAPRTIAAQVTQKFVQNPAASRAYAAFTVPHGTVFAEPETQDQPSGSVVTALRAMNVQIAFGTGTGGATPAVVTGHVLTTRGGLSLEGRIVTTTSSTTTPSTGLPGRRAVAGARDVEVLTSPAPVMVDQGGGSAVAVTEFAAVVRETLDPSELLKVRVRALITAPAGAFGDEAVPARMTFSPSYPLATYELLARIDPELMLPGVGRIPDDTCALAKLNAPFVEAFLLGANHELGREFIWREVPVDPADTWLRTFWDSAGAEVEHIARVADWTTGPLGTNPATTDFDPKQILVLIVKGDLLRRYPRTLVYAVPARWSNENEKQVWERVEDEKAEPEQPIFVGSLGKDVVFLGFQFDANIDVDVDVAGSTQENGPHPGWFFAFEQPPIEPRFGLDQGNEGQTGKKPKNWKNVSWYHALGEDTAATHAPLAPLDDDVARPYDVRGENTWTETWARHAAAMARVTLQRPVRMLVHADQMLRPQEEK